ncbi:MAG: efflux RND transporter permease subunit, partial [Candidatus Omnitrophica bacterium]|nr:efflux RND transporter permease subunit [Candidatus Omnitrophota bacterium]
MTLSDFSIKNPVFAWMLMVGLILFGAISFHQMGVSQMPDVDFPVVSVSLTWEGAAPEVMETDVVDVVEDALMSLQGIRDLSSSTRQGSANVTVEFDLERDIDLAFQDVQAKLAQAQRRLPEDLDPPIISKVNPQDNPIMWIGVSGDVPLRELTAYVQDHLRDRFQTVQGVGEVMLGGFRERTRWAWVDADRLAQYQLTVSDVVDAIQREHREAPAGRLETGQQEFNVRAFGEAATPEAFGDLVIARRGGQPVYRPIFLKDVAQIEDGLADERRIARVMGKPAVGLGIQKQRGANEVDVAHRVLERLTDVQRALPPGIAAGVNFNRTQFIEDSIQELTFTLLLSALLTSLVCWFFLGSWSATVNILMAIPTAIIGTFIALNFLGFTLNTFTLLGLSLAIGIVVDDAIMVLENIVRHRELGTEKVEAARQGARQITGAALAATLAIIAIFLPVAFMAGLIGRFFFEFGMTISIAVALSLLEALTLAPMRCAQFLRVEPRHTRAGRAVEQGFQRLAEGYRRTLPRVLRRRGLVLLVTLLAFAGSLTLLGRLRKEFVPPQDQSMFLCRLQTPVGSSLEFTNERFKQAEQFAMSRPELKRYFGAIGGFGGGEVNTGVLFVTFKPPRERPVVPPNRRPLSQQELMTEFRKELNTIPDARVTIQDMSLSQLSAQRGFPIELTVRGPDWGRLVEAAQTLEQRMAASPLLVDVDTDYLASVPEVRVRPNRDAAAARGVSTEAIADTINALIGGTRVAKYTDSGRRYDVRVRLMPGQRTQAEDIERLWVRNNRGELVQLKEVGTISREPALTTITRRGRERAIGLFANVAPGQSQQTALEEVQRLGREVLP